MIRIFIGYDKRQPLAYNVLQYSILANATEPVSITPLNIDTLPITRRGLTAFTYTRYLVPWLCNYEGRAIFLDADMVVDADIKDLADFTSDTAGVTVCQSPPKPGFEWPSAMLFNNARCKRLTIDLIERGTPQDLAAWSDGGIGDFPTVWNYCVGYDTADICPSLVHYTAGIPIWPETRDCKFAAVWHKYHRAMNASVAYAELMASSVHHKRVLDGSIK
jgi:hypothetical protein